MFGDIGNTFAGWLPQGRAVVDRSQAVGQPVVCGAGETAWGDQVGALPWRCADWGRPTSGCERVCGGMVIGGWLRGCAAAGDRRAQSGGRSPSARWSVGVAGLRAQSRLVGARKLRLARQGLQPLPAVSTISAILRRHGPHGPRPGGGPGARLRSGSMPSLWQMDCRLALRPRPLPSMTIRATARGWRPCPIRHSKRAADARAFQRYGMLRTQRPAPPATIAGPSRTAPDCLVRSPARAGGQPQPGLPRRIALGNHFHGTLRPWRAQPPQPDLPPGRAALRLAAPVQPRAPARGLGLAVPASRSRSAPGKPARRPSRPAGRLAPSAPASRPPVAFRPRSSNGLLGRHLHDRPLSSCCESA